MAAKGGVALRVPFIGPEIGRWAVEGARPATNNGAVSCGGGNGEGKQGVGEIKGVVATFHFAMGREGVLRRGGETATQSARWFEPGWRRLLHD
jgi:hypothetical protein